MAGAKIRTYAVSDLRPQDRQLHVRDVPADVEPRLYPPDEVIGRETTRNREAVRMLAETADCVYRVVGRTCGGPGR